MKCVLVKKDDGKQVIIKCNNETELSEIRRVYEGKIISEGDTLQECIQKFQIWLEENHEELLC